MTSLLTGAPREVPATTPLRKLQQPDHSRPELRWQSHANLPGRILLGLFLAIARPLLVWQQRLRDRAALQRLPDHLLRDIGLDPAEVQAEAEKPFWRA